MAVLVWTAQLTTGTLVINLTDKISFWAAAGFDTAIAVDAFNGSTHIENAAETHLCTSEHVSNTRRTGVSTVSIQEGTSEDLVNILEAECPLKINFADASTVDCTSVTLDCYGPSDTEDPAGMIAYAAELGDTSWTDIRAASGTPLAIDDSLADTSHDFFMSLSVTPSAAGVKTGTLIFELTYS